ncbi:hypothetical protein CAEBREN_20502 [Caenorhabditis brenneri]|uniref:Sdz-33 F-box domain-containing protein n=1 Tax=Caenorhabditis brenneri TaxID=135651 RepID=G0N424_CAEBE|nr:hypothetical protein CAEBREN_20502 [Caenorhabditis brenneri]
MSLSRPAKFPLLKLPWLCIKCVLVNWDLFHLIYFATISNRTRRIVQHSKYPLNEIDVSPNSSCKSVCMGKEKNWNFTHDKFEFGDPLILRRNSEPFLTRRGSNWITGNCLESYTAGDPLDALKTGIEFMIDVFGCTVRRVFVDGDKLSELFGLGISTVKVLFLCYSERVNMADLKFLLENINVTDSYVFFPPIPENFSCDPQIFKCRLLLFAGCHSADWVTLELLCQFDVAQMSFTCQRFSEEEIVSYITHWFNSVNRKLEWIEFEFNDPSLENFNIESLNPMPFSEKRRNRCPLVKRWKEKDISNGMDIIRRDGLLATFYVDVTSVIFYVWHKRFPDAVQQ